MNESQIRSFFSVAETLSFSRAAEIAFTSQSSISRQISSLEKELGVILFIRDKHNVQLTEAGKYLYEQFSDLQHKAMDHIAYARRLNNGKSGKLSIGYQLQYDFRLILPSIKQFMETNPSIDVSIMAYNFSSITYHLIVGTVDVVFAPSFVLPDNAFVERVPFLKGHPVAVISKNHPLSRKPNISLSDLNGSPLVLCIETPEGQNYCLEICNKYGISLSNRIFAETCEAQLSYVELYQGFALVDSFTQFTDDNRYKLIAIDDINNNSINIDLIWRKDNNNAAVSLLSKQLISHDAK